MAEVKNNTFDMAERGYYQWVVIEEVRPGIYPIPVESEVWYEWVGYKLNSDGSHREVMRFVRLEEKPEIFQGTFNHSIG